MELVEHSAAAGAIRVEAEDCSTVVVLVGEIDGALRDDASASMAQALGEFVAKNAPAHIPDFRPTLYWNPDVKTNAEGKATINFQTSDDMGNLRVQIEGITKDGKLISEQLLIPVQPTE